MQIKVHIGVDGDEELKSKMDSAGASMDKLTDKTETASDKTQSLTRDYIGAAQQFSLAASSISSLWFQFDNLEKAQLRVDRAEKTLTSSNAGVIRAQESLNKLVQDGITSGPEYESAVLKLSAAQQKLDNDTRALAIAQGDMSQAQLGFALSVVPSVMGAVTGLSGGLQALGIITKITNAETAASGLAFKGATIGAIGHKIAVGASALATKGLALATKLLHLAMGPVGLIILGVTTFLGLFATNAFGVRDAINSMGKAIGDAIPILRPLLDTLAGIANTIFPQAEEETQSLGDVTAATLTDMGSEYEKLQQEIAANTSQVTILNADMAQQHTEAFNNLNEVTRTTSAAVSQSLNNLGTDTEKNADRIVKAANKAAAALMALSLVSRGSTKDKTVSGVKKAATGFSGLVTQPTLFLAGERGPETVNIAPVQAGARSGPLVVTVITQLDGREVARTVNKFQGRNIQ
jgi:hypothetical protein